MKPAIVPAFADEIARVQRNDAVLQETYRLRQHAGDANRAVDTAKVALADAVIAAGGCFTRADLVRAVLVGIAHMAGEDVDYIAQNRSDVGDAERLVDEMLRGET